MCIALLYVCIYQLPHPCFPVPLFLPVFIAGHSSTGLPAWMVPTSIHLIYSHPVSFLREHLCNFILLFRKVSGLSSPAEQNLSIFCLVRRPSTSQCLPFQHRLSPLPASLQPDPLDVPSLTETWALSHGASYMSSCLLPCYPSLRVRLSRPHLLSSMDSVDYPQLPPRNSCSTSRCTPPPWTHRTACSYP